MYLIGIATMLRLPAAENSSILDACFVGVPMDQGTSNRSGTRYQYLNQHSLMQFKSDMLNI